MEGSGLAQRRGSWIAPGQMLGPGEDDLCDEEPAMMFNSDDSKNTTIRIAAAVLMTALLCACGYDGPKLDAPGLKAALAESGEPLLVLDVRPRSQFEKSHIDGARNIPLEEMTAAQNQLVLTRRKIAVICTCGRRSLEAVRMLQESGKTAILVEGGMTEWEAAGYPTVASKDEGP